jgi:CrcB protein
MNWVVLSAALAGGAGAAARFSLDGWITRVSRFRIPVGTVVINVSGSFALGMVAALAASGLLPAPAQTIVGSGFLAGYTTFSTASTQTSDLILGDHPADAAAYGGGMFAGSLAAAAAGMWCGSLFV